MFEYCGLVDVKSCAFSGRDNSGTQRCGLATKENVISEMKTCPLEKHKANKGTNDPLRMMVKREVISKKKSEIKLKKIKKILDL